MSRKPTKRSDAAKLADFMCFTIYSTNLAYSRVYKPVLEQLGVTIENAEITMQPQQTVPVGEDKAVAVLRLMESLEEDDDVQQVYANFDIPTNVLERVSAQV